jgi:hypothetical protein
MLLLAFAHLRRATGQGLQNLQLSPHWRARRAVPIHPFPASPALHKDQPLGSTSLARTMGYGFNALTRGSNKEQMAMNADTKNNV